MWINSVEIKNFRNYKKAQVIFSKGLNYVHGFNGAGKTNLLEVVGLLSHGKSMRLRNSEDLIKDGFNNAFLKGAYENDKRENLVVNFALTKSMGKRITVNGKAVLKISDVFRLAPTVQCFEKDTELLQGSPAIRRNFLDCLCAQLYPAYLKYHSEYRNVLNQRNSALKNSTLKGALKIAIDEVFIKKAVPVIQLRQETLSQLSLIIERQKDSFDKESNFIISESSFLDSSSVDFITSMLYEKLEKLSSEELRYFRTSAGPHRDSIDFKAGESKIRGRSSRGQIKNMIFRLKMAEFELLKTKLKKTPIVLLDDVFAEMDYLRSKNLGKLLELGAQVFLASTAPPSSFLSVAGNSMRKIEIDNGVVVSNSVILSAA